MPRRGGKRKKARTHKGDTPEGVTILPTVGSSTTDVNDALIEKQIDSSIPRTIVAKVGKIGNSVTELVKDFRKLMNPHTASNLRERR